MRFRLRRHPALCAVVLAALCTFPRSASATELPPAPVLPEVLRLEDALRIFRERGLDLLIAEAQVKNAEGDVKVAGAVPNPNFSIYGSYTYSDPNVSPAGVAASLGDSNALEDTLSGKRGLRLKVARAALAAAKLGRADAERTLVFQVKQQYLQAVLARDLLDFALEVQKGATRTFELIKVRHAAGAISEADEAKVETAKLEADQAVDSAVQALRVAKLGVAFLLGVRGPVPQFHIEQDLPAYEVPAHLGDTTPERLIDEAIANRPDLRAADRQRERADAALRLARRNRFPDLSLNVSYQQNGPFATTSAQPPTVSFGIIGTLPLFYFQRGEILKAEADRRVQDLQRAKLQAQVVTDVETAWANFSASRRLVERMQARLLDRAKRARDLVEIQYQKGAASLLELLDAQRQWIANNQEYLQDLAGYWTALYQLEQAVGTELR